MFNFGFKRKKNGLPKQGLLVWLKASNSDNVLDDESTLIDESLADIGYALPVSCHTAVGTGFWFTDATTPITRLMSEILLDAGTNIDTGLVFASLRRGVASYSEGQTGSAVVKLSRYFEFTL